MSVIDSLHPHYTIPFIDMQIKEVTYTMRTSVLTPQASPFRFGGSTQISLFLGE